MTVGIGTVVLTMAGRSARFRAVGVDTPKWALRVGDRSILEWAVESLRPVFDDGWDLHLVALDHDVDRAAFAAAVAAMPADVRWTALPSTPLGQAHSALAARHAVQSGRPLAVWNADTHLLPGAEPLHQNGGNWLTVAPLEGSHWSFAVCSDDGAVLRTAEKRRISPWASIGFYGFEGFDVLERALLRHASIDAESYIAPLYNELVAERSRVDCIHVPASRVVPFGTPDEVLDSCTALGLEAPKELRAYAARRARSDGATE